MDGDDYSNLCIPYQGGRALTKLSCIPIIVAHFTGRGSMILQTLTVGPLAVNCYLVGDDRTREVIVIDPGGDVRQIVQASAQARARVVAIVLTHAHFDHVTGIAGLKEETGAPLMMSAQEAPFLTTAKGQAAFFGLAIPTPPPPDRLLNDGDVIRAGALALSVLLTPGHSPGGICLWSDRDRILFSGDTLMRGSIGRTDLPGGSMETLMHSIRTKLMTLARETTVYPGHGPITTIGEELMLNPFLKNYV
jgi:hydroxyacylglutathione hydrolase